MEKNNFYSQWKWLRTGWVLFFLVYYPFKTKYRIHYLECGYQMWHINRWFCIIFAESKVSLAKALSGGAVFFPWDTLKRKKCTNKYLKPHHIVFSVTLTVRDRRNTLNQRCLQMFPILSEPWGFFWRILYLLYVLRPWSIHHIDIQHALLFHITLVNI